jgi:hypothetical protein
MSAKVDFEDRLYVLDLPALVAPTALERRAVECRARRREDRDLLVSWRIAYDVEVLGAVDSADSAPDPQRFSTRK